ncbi:MAG: hypothetical protein L7V86_24230 [Verrucomicrobiales bacterium]|nr:hypothetical protein [Verrucomicrobiales bacterium]
MNRSTSDVEKLLSGIDSHKLPQAYDAWKNQPYVEKRLEGMTTEQRARLGQLWKEKQRLDPEMPNRKEFFCLLYNSGFKNPEAEKLRREFVSLNQFQESWSTAIKAGNGGFQKFELYDLSNDPNQRTDIAAQHPELVARLKKQLQDIYASVLADAPTWGSGASTPPNGLEKLLAEIDTYKLPQAYNPSNHQPYVDKRMEGMTTKQRARLGHLWKEKQRLDPKMPNRGRSFIRILEFTAKE